MLYFNILPFSMSDTSNPLQKKTPTISHKLPNHGHIHKLGLCFSDAQSFLMLSYLPSFNISAYFKNMILNLYPDMKNSPISSY